MEILCSSAESFLGVSTMVTSQQLALMAANDVGVASWRRHGTADTAPVARAAILGVLLYMTTAPDDYRLA